MDKFLGVLGSVGKIEKRLDNDRVDRLNYRYTMSLLAIFALVVTTTQYVGKPMTCWTPAEFKDQMTKYTDTWCWTKGTYYHPMEEVVPRENEPRMFEVAYYIWVPLFLMIQALLFYIPIKIWYIFNNRTGCDMNTVVKTAAKLGEVVQDKREVYLKYLVRYIDNYLTKNRDNTRTSKIVRIQRFLSQKLCCICCGKRTGSFMWTLYMLVKVLYIINVIGQLFILNVFIGSNYHVYGFEVMKDLAQGNDWRTSPVFPRVTLCSFKMRVLGNVHRHTFQCVLPVNLFNEKIYIFIWFWFVFVAAATCLNFLSWLLKSLSSTRRAFFKKHLVWMGRLQPNGNSESDKKLYRMFTEKYLRPDGYLIMRFITVQCSEFVVSDIVAALWDNYKRIHPLKEGLLEFEEDEKNSDKDM
ncbi:unnamed protein product [Owenia fusiformis]|uniref:Innexin n=1 Tax=Owenia fusiformis TaxID=6347 RepID=A0A8S4NMS3_OWEFU|nr:unnamed protein product [Owenia fusiformis]